MNDPRIFWVGFNLVKGIGAVRFKALLDHFGDAQVAWEAPAQELSAAGLTNRIIDNLVQVRASVDLNAIWEELAAKQVNLVTWPDENYPRRLKEIDQSPPVLFVRGELCTADEWAVAVVGTRRISSYGRQVAEQVGAFLAHNGVTVVSGLARGVDSAAHQAAMNAGGRTLAVLGCGVDRIYPPENRRLAQQIIESGAIISDYPLGTQPESYNFPPRNRIISGLSIAVVIVEAGESSGAVITSTFAAEQGREVFAVPGNIYAPQSKGTNKLIQQGAHPLLQPEDLLEALNLTLATEQQAARTVLPADATEAKLFEVLTHEPTHVDEICAITDLPVSQVSASLTLMELKGLVRQVGNMHYVAIRELQSNYQVDET
jgi:DNA processing protein